MANIRLDLDRPVVNGRTLTFKSPVDCTNVTGLATYYVENGVETSRVFQFADAHGNNVGNKDLFAENAFVKVILDTELDKAYVQNADTNAYLEGRFDKKLSIDDLGRISDPIVLKAGVHYGDSYPTDAVVGQLFFINIEAVSN